jgi:hypothetical protein
MEESCSMSKRYSGPGLGDIMELEFMIYGSPHVQEFIWKEIVYNTIYRADNSKSILSLPGAKKIRDR